MAVIASSATVFTVGVSKVPLAASPANTRQSKYKHERQARSGPLWPEMLVDDVSAADLGIARSKLRLGD
jgi:hypothetical protein